ncbi:MAG: putative RNA methyltransferase [Cyanobacteria bacterium J06554_1]
MVYSCPICSSPLSKTGRAFRCRTGHTFDIAKEGYVNLLPANRKRSLEPGDNAEMVSARSRFLGAGYYKTLADELVNLIDQPRCLADLGCGEGYFTAALCEVAREVYGLDISKVAVRAACKQSRARFVVASTMRLPFLSKVFDAVTVIMAPTSPDIPRVLKKGALLCRVSPGERHLVELRELAYREVRAVKQPRMDIDGLTNVGCERVRFDTLLKSDGLIDLIAMTPMQFRTSKDFQEQVSQLDELCVTADFRVDLFRKH